MLYNLLDLAKQENEPNRFAHSEEYNKLYNELDDKTLIIDILEKDWGCPLEVLFKARNGFYTNVGYISPEHIYNIDIKNQTIEFEWLTEDGYWDEDGLVEFEKYKKNWWLNEDGSA